MPKCSALAIVDWGVKETGMWEGGGETVEEDAMNLSGESPISQMMLPRMDSVQLSWKHGSKPIPYEAHRPSKV